MCYVYRVGTQRKFVLLCFIKKIHHVRPTYRHTLRHVRGINNVTFFFSFFFRGQMERRLLFLFFSTTVS
jgi:hypothetical protein